MDYSVGKVQLVIAICAKKNYQKNAKTVTTKMLTSATDSEKCINLITSVWYNAIFKVDDSTTDKYTKYLGSFVDDFNVALGNLMGDSSFNDTQKSIRSNTDDINKLMKKLSNPPKKYKDEYAAIKKLYGSYLKLVTISTDPSGNYDSYDSKATSADSEFSSDYDALKMYLDL